MNKRAVIFDMDGCLVDSELIMLSVIAQKMRILNIPGANVANIADKFLGVSMTEICSTLMSSVDGTSADEFAESVERLAIKRYELELKPIAGLNEALARLDALGCNLAIATGASKKRMKATLKATNLTSVFGKNIANSDEVASGKPAPDLFFLASDKIGVPPANCFVVEDSPFGVEGAVSAGMIALGFVGGSHLNNTREKHAKTLRKAGAIDVAYSLGDIVDQIEASFKRDSQSGAFGI
jgi:HAD superfamily hydrolase (TIGR01509 family)|tara:strand:- start:181 stop:897 length:717 start_codon:yes stop_codon:yes gene_type:complete